MNKSVTIHFTTDQQIPFPDSPKHSAYLEQLTSCFPSEVAFIKETSQHLSNKSVEKAQVNILLRAQAAVLELDIWKHDEFFYLAINV